MASESNNNIVVVGSCMIDFTSYCSKLPKIGETVHGHKFETGFGGKGANQCVAAARLGGKAAIVARVGSDEWGKKYIDKLNGENIDTHQLIMAPLKTTGIAQILVSDSGENQIVIVAGANNDLNSSDIHDARNLISSAAVLVCQLETSPDVALKAIELCKGISILNGAPAIEKYDPMLLKLPTIFCVNESEAAVFCGSKVKSESDAKKAAIKLLSKGCNSVIITLGSKGALYANQKERKEVIHVQAPKVKCVDTVGAGDAFIGALAYLLANKKIEMAKAIEIACGIAADSVTRHGTQTSFPNKEILDKYFSPTEAV